MAEQGGLHEVTTSDAPVALCSGNARFGGDAALAPSLLGATSSCSFSICTISPPSRSSLDGSGRRGSIRPSRMYVPMKGAPSPETDAEAQVPRRLSAPAPAHLEVVVPGAEGNGTGDRPKLGSGRLFERLASSELSPRSKEEQVQVVTSTAVGGAAIGGTAGGVAGGALGTAIGAVAGLPLAIFTFGLSIPAGALLGGGTGACVGTTAGAGAGLAAGGAVGYAAHATHRQIRQGAEIVHSVLEQGSRGAQNRRGQVEEGKSSEDLRGPIMGA